MTTNCMFDSTFCFVSPLLSRLLSASPTWMSSERLPVGDLLWIFEVPAELRGSGSSETASELVCYQDVFWF